MKIFLIASLFLVLSEIGTTYAAGNRGQDVGENPAREAAAGDLVWANGSWAINVEWDGDTMYVYIPDRGRPTRDLVEKTCKMLRKHGAADGVTVQLRDYVRFEFFGKINDFEKLACDAYFRK